jgi:hypothetical protein
MRGTVAKRLRREVYGEEFAPRARSYAWVQVGRLSVRGGAMRVADPKRRAYQAAKRARR